MDEQTTKKPYRSSVQLQFAAYFFLLTVVLLALLNTYPLRASRDVVFSEKESALMSRASVLSSSLSLMETLTEDNTRQVLSLLDTTGLERVLVTDPEGTPLYDTLDAAAAPAEVKTALKGKAAFRGTRSARSTFWSTTPIRRSCWSPSSTGSARSPSPRRSSRSSSSFSPSA